MKRLSLNEVIRLTRAKEAGANVWYGFCPVHGDAHTPNLKIEPGAKGGAKVYCHPHGCEQKRIWASLRAAAATVRKTSQTNEGINMTVETKKTKTVEQLGWSDNWEVLTQATYDALCASRAGSYTARLETLRRVGFREKHWGDKLRTVIAHPVMYGSMLAQLKVCTLKTFDGKRKWFHFFPEYDKNKTEDVLVGLDEVLMLESGSAVNVLDAAAVNPDSQVMDYDDGGEGLFYNGEALFITEGQWDMLCLREMGYAALGLLNAEQTELGKDIVSLIDAMFDRVFLLPDADGSGVGKSAMERVAKLLPAHKTFIVEYPIGKDACEMRTIMGERGMRTSLECLCSEAVYERQDAGESVCLVEGEVATVEVKVTETVDTLGGDLIGDATRLLTDGTPIPPQFVRESIKVVLGAALRDVDYPAHPNLHTREFLFLISPPQGCKEESGLRTFRQERGYFHGLLREHGVGLLQADGFSSGVFAAMQIAQQPHCVIWYDEAVKWIECDDATPSHRLTTIYTTLFESNRVAVGSVKGRKEDRNVEVNDAHVSLVAPFTEESWRSDVPGKRLASSGCLSRGVLAYAELVPKMDKWAPTDKRAVADVVAAIAGRLPHRGTAGLGNGRLSLAIAPEAEAAFAGFCARLNDPSNREYSARLQDLVKRDGVLRTVFGYADSLTITGDAMRRAVAWGDEQLRLRMALYPCDRGSPVARFETVITRVLQNAGQPLTERELIDFTNARKSEGRMEAFNRAIRALLVTGEVYIAKKTRKGRPIYAWQEDEPNRGNESQ